MEETTPPSKTSDENPWPVTEDQSSSHDGSRRWPDWNTSESLKYKDTSEWPSWEFSQGNKEIQKGDNMDTEVLASADSSFDEQRGRGRRRDISRDGGCNDEQRGQSKIRKRGRSRSRQREYRKSRSRSPCNGLRQASGMLFEKGSVSENSYKRCRDFAAGKCSRGSQCRFLHQGYLNSRHRDHPRNELTDKSKFRADDRRNERVAYDQKVKPLDKRNDIGHCKFFSIGRCYRNDCRFSHDVGRVTTGFLDAAKTKKWDDVYSLDRPKAELSGRGEDEIKSEKCSAWDKFASESEEPKDTTGWGKWPGKPDNYIWNSSSHDYPGGEKTRLNQKSFQHGTKAELSGSREDEIKSEKCSAWDKFASESEKPKDTTGWGKWPGKPDNYIWNSSSRDYPGGEKSRLNQKSFQHGTKAELSGRGEDEIKSKKCSAWDKFASESEKPMDTTGWGKWPGKPDNYIWNSISHDYPGGEKTRLNQKGFQHGKKLSVREEDEIKSEKCSAWDKYAGVSEKPKDNSGWDKWPGKGDNYIWNSNSHDTQSKRWDGSSKGNICSQKLSEVKIQIDDNILRNSVRKSGKRIYSGSNEKLSEQDKLMDLNKPVDGEKAMGQGKDKTELWNGPTWDNDWSLDGPKAKLSVWGENVKKSENGSAWDKVASVSGRPKDTTSRENWPAWPDSSNANSNSHDPQNKTWDDRSRGSVYPQDLIDGNIAHNFVQKDTTKSLNGPTWGDGGCSLDRQKASGRSGRENGNKDPHVFADVGKSNDVIMAHSSLRDITKSWNGPTWGGEGCSLDRPKATIKGDKATGNRDPRIRVDVEERNDGNTSHSFVQKGIQNSSSEWNKKVTVRDANRLSPLQNDYNGAGSNTNEVSDSVKLNDGKKSPNQGEDQKNSWNTKCDDSACFLDNAEAFGWGGSRSSNDKHCHDPVDEEKPSQNNLVKMAVSGQDNKVVGKDEYRPTHMLNGREGVDKDTGDLLASKKVFYRKENQIDAQGSEPGGFIFPPSSLIGSGQSSHALSPNPLNGFNIILDESVKYKLSALVNQMQNQFEEALKIIETWACQNSITADQALRLSKIQAYLSENGVHVKPNEVLEKLKMEYLESSAKILKQQEPVGYTEPNEKTVMVEKVGRNNSKGEQCEKEKEIIQSVGADERCEAGESKQDERSRWLFKNALVKLVKEILNPIWKEGQMKKEVHNTIVKKVVDKVISTEGANITSIQEHTEQYLSFSKPHISALINNYVGHFKRVADSS